LARLASLKPRFFTSPEIPLRSYTYEFPLLPPCEVTPLSSFPLTYYDAKFEGVTAHDAQSVSEDIYHQNELVPVEIFLVALETLRTFDFVQVSDDLLKEIDVPRTISGMTYADRYWKTETLPSVVGERKPTTRPRSPVRPKDLYQMGTTQVSQPRFTPSFWDLIFVLLQPPMELGVTESLLIPGELYPYQAEGVRFLISSEHALLADDMGTGKTVMTIVALKILIRDNKAKRALILCPPSILYEWRRHLADWAPELVACFVRGAQGARSHTWRTPAHVYVTTYDTLKNDLERELLKKGKESFFDVVVIDEAHHIKNPNTKRSRAIKKLTPRYRWALTGTPIQNKIEDMAALFEFIHPGLISSFDLHQERIKKKVAPYFLRRRKQDVLKDLPPKLKDDVWLEMSEEQKREYVRVEREVQTGLEGLGEKITRQHVFAQMQRLKQICNFPANSGMSPKLEMLKDQLEDIVESGSKIIVFSQYVDQGTRKLEAGLKPYGLATIVGGQSDKVRMQAIHEFKNRPDVPILIVSTRSGGEGLNLTEASYVVHFDHWWNPAVMWQAEDRVHRRGQTHNVNIYSYWMLGTIDERIYRILEQKGLLIQNVVDGLAETTIEELFTMDDLLEMVGVKKTAPARPTFDPRQWQHLGREQVRQRLLQISPREFEDLVERLMHYLGYPNVKVTKRSGDGGIDVLSTRLTEKGVERVAVQCKRYRNPVGVQIAREFLGAIRDDASIVKGYLVTTSEFTSECIGFCLRHQIEMIPGIKMADYVQRFGLEM